MSVCQFCVSKIPIFLSYSHWLDVLSHPTQTHPCSYREPTLVFFRFHFACAFFELVEIFVSAAMQLQYIIIHSTRGAPAEWKIFSPFCLFSHSISFSIVSGPRRRVCAASVFPPIQPPWFPNDKSFQIDHPTSQPCLFFFSFFSHLFKTLRTKNQLMFHLFYFPL
jgi:hypothetical protein